MIENRSGYFIQNTTGYKSFVPKRLPPNPPLTMDSEIIFLLSDADREIGRLDGITQILPNPELFVNMYAVEEALISSQIEGTQASLVDVLGTPREYDENKLDIIEVNNYTTAMSYGLERIHELPLSLRLLKEIHHKLLNEGRGSNLNPGEFRTSQNWIGKPGSTIANAEFIPPSVPDMKVAMNDLENFIHENDTISALVKIALIHAQFETIHPFLDGNGRMCVFRRIQTVIPGLSGQRFRHYADSDSGVIRTAPVAN